MNIFQSILKITTVLVVIFVFTSCDDDYSEIGGELIENPSGVELEEFDVITYTSKLEAVQTNYTNINTAKLLGVYNSGVYGQNVASIVTGLNIEETNPDFPADATLDSVVLEIPYFSQQQNSTSSATSFQLDSVYGDSPIKLSIYESNYFLREVDPESNFQDSQKYYSNQQEVFESYKGDKIYENSSYFPSSDPVTVFVPNAEGENDTVVRNPALRVKLDADFFQSKIIDQASKLSSQADFDDYFRGLYFKAESIADNGNMTLLDMGSEDAGVTLYYSYENDEGEEASGNFELSFDNKKINLFEGQYPESILSEINMQDTLAGAENLYLRGGEGSMAIVKLFPDEQRLEDLRARNLIINEANLTFYVRNDIDLEEASSRIYLYDLDNKTIIADAANASFSVTPATSAQTIFGPLQEYEDGYQGYRLRLTAHMVNLLASEDTNNVRLGLVVVSNVNSVVTIQSSRGISAVNNTSIKEAMPGEVEAIPSVSVISPKGTVLYGNTATDEVHRPKLKIYYTETGI